MCDQTELTYSDGAIVWVKFHNFWWPGEVHGESKLPPDLLKSFRKMPVAIVKFFQENAYEYVKSINDIYLYNCNRKHEFIKKGLDLHRAKKRNMEKFPEDVRIAEQKTGGDTNILEREEFQPEQKPNIANIFGDQTPKVKKNVGRGRPKSIPTEENLTYSRTKVSSSKLALNSQTISTTKSYTTSSLSSNRLPSCGSASMSNNEFHCHLCNFTTTRLNVIVLHNKTHSSENKLELQPAAKVVKSTITTSIKKSPAKRGRKPKLSNVELVLTNENLDHLSEDLQTQSSDSEYDNGNKVPPKKGTRASPKKRQSRKCAAIAENTTNEDEVPNSSMTQDKGAQKTSRKLQITQIKGGEKDKVKEVQFLAPDRVESEEVQEPTEIKKSLLADWSDVEDDDDDECIVSTSKQLINDDLISSPNQSGDEKQPKQTIRNIPKKDRRGIILDEFYAKHVPSISESDTEKETTHKEEMVLNESDEDTCSKDETNLTQSNLACTMDEKSALHIDIIANGANKARDMYVVESTTDDKSTDDLPDDMKGDSNLLKQGNELLEETIPLPNKMETVGIIDKKRRLLHKHKVDEEYDSGTNAERNDEECGTQQIEDYSDDQEEDNKINSSSLEEREISANVTKTYQSISSQHQQSSSSDEKSQSDNKKDDRNEGYIKGEKLSEIDDLVNIKPIKKTSKLIDQVEQKKIVEKNESVEKMEIDETSPSKIDTADVDCFDFKEEDDEIPQTLNRRKRRCLPPGKVFEFETIDKLEEMRKKEESLESKRPKLDRNDKDQLNSNLDYTKSNLFEDSSDKLMEKQQRDDDLKDSKTLPPKERGKRIFKSRNKSNLSEGDSFSNDEKSPTKEANQYYESIEKSLADSTMESPKSLETLKTEAEETPNKTTNIQDGTDFINKLDDSQIESEVANTLITLTNSPVKVTLTDSIVTSTDKGNVISTDLDLLKNQGTLTTAKNPPTNALNEKKSSKNVDNSKVIEETKHNEKIPATETAVIISPSKKMRYVNEEAKINSDNDHCVNQLNVTNITEQSMPLINLPESSNQGKDVGNKEDSVPEPKIKPTEVSTVSSTSTSKLTQQQKKTTRSARKKVPVTIGYDLQGNPIITYRKPSDKPVVHLPSHIQTPDMVQTINPALLHTTKLNNSNLPTQFVITSKGALFKTNNSTPSNQTTTTAIPGRTTTQIRPNASTSYASQMKTSSIPMIHLPTQQSINPHLIHKPKTNQQIQQIVQHHFKSSPSKQKITTNIVQHTPSPAQKTGSSLNTANKQINRQHDKLICQQTEGITHSQSEEMQSTEMFQNAEDNQLLAIPAENFSGPTGAFYLCKIAENNMYIPIDNQPLYLDEKNQLIPGNLINTNFQEELVEEALIPQSQQLDYQQDQIVQNTDESSNLKYLLNVDGQQILLDQQSLMQLTSGGEMQQLVTADGQRLILQGSAQDILAAIQANQQEQIIIPEDIIEQDPNSHEIIPNIEDSEVYQQGQYIGDVLQIQPGNGIETVDSLTFQTIAPTSETNAILPPIMSTLEQPSKTDVSSPNVDCANLDESLAVIGVTVSSTNVPTSLELPITITNPAIAPRTTNAITTIYPSNIPITLPQALQTSLNSDFSTDCVEESVLIQEDEHYEIVPNTPESVINHGFTSDNSNSSEIPLQSNLILRPPHIESMEKDEENRTEPRRTHMKNQAQQNDRNDASILLSNSDPGLQVVESELNASFANQNSRRTRNRNNSVGSNEMEPHIFIIEQIIDANNVDSEYNTNDVENVEQFNS